MPTSRSKPNPVGDPPRDPPSSSETQVLERIAPGVTWWPRWFRKHLTPQMVIGAIVVIFSAGTFWANFRTARDVKDAQREVREFRETFNRKLDEIGDHSAKVDVIEKGQRDLDERVRRLEDNYDYAAREAGTPPYPRHAPARRPK